MNKIITNPDLANVDYTDLLIKILQTLKQEQIFKISEDHKRIRIDVNKIASKVVNLQVQNPLGNAKSVRAATLNFTSDADIRFRELISEIFTCVQQSLTAAIPQNQSLDRVKFIEKLITNLQDNFKGEYNYKEDANKEGLNRKDSNKVNLKKDKKTLILDLTYTFTPLPYLQKQRLTVEPTTSQTRKLLKVHKLKISVDKTQDFYPELIQGINNFINIKFADVNPTQREELEYILEDLQENNKSDVYKLQKLVNQETLGKLKKLAKIKYLDFLHENIDQNASEENFKGKIYLEDLIRRLKKLDDYINDPNKADGEYLVSYAKTEINYRNFFSRSEAYDMLPIIPLVEGYLGETEDQNRENIEFTFGLKLKFDGKVQAYGGKNVFEYNLNLLNPDSDEHKKEIADESRKSKFIEKVLRIAFLYYFLFASDQKFQLENYNPQDELQYDPLDTFEKEVLPILRKGKDEEKQELFRKLIKDFQELNVQAKIDTLKRSLKKLIKYQTPFPTKEYPLHISVKNSILENDINTIRDRDTLFKEDLRGNFKDCLKYINIGEATTQTNSLVSLKANMTISETYFLETNDREFFSMEYDIQQNIGVLPVIFLPLEDKTCQKFYNDNLQNRNLLIFSYRVDTKKLDPYQEFIYKTAYSLLAYICLYVLLEKQTKLFIPILKIHPKNKTDEAPIEKFIVSLTAVLSHLLNTKYRANSQGIDISDFETKGNYKIPNVLSSLYSVLPKKFTIKNLDKFQFQELDKLAIIVVSSRVCDSTWNSEAKKSNLMGEIIDLQIQPQTVTLRLLKTFSENYDDHQKMFEYPNIVIENVNKLYKKGYRHFIYIAKVPYSSTLHITQTAEDDELFFMSKNVIKELKAEREDIKIYPMFFDKYYAVNLHNTKSTSLYIQDTIALTKLVEDSNKKSVIFFNLFNGFAISDDSNYNGVMSYATLLNIYKGILDDEDIRNGLISNHSQLKNEILQCLTLFHFSRYEKSKDIQLKLDPYENLIGDKSVGELALFKHSRGKADFNSLAFLTYVKSILDNPEAKK